MNVNTLTPSSTLLTPLLQGLQPLPKQLFYFGDNFNNIIRMPRLTVVGSRKHTPYGAAVTRQLVREAGQLGLVIVSGLALGIDSIAHTTALECNTPTIAILPAGLNTIAPASHRGLAEQIVRQGGALVSEYPIGTPVFKQHFVARDRLMAAFGDAILITEAAAKSGTMHTAGFALTIGRPVLAVPGPITSPLSEGTNNLIKAGAQPVTNIDDVLCAMRLTRTQLQTQAPISNLTADEQCLVTLMRQGVTDGTSLQLQSKLSAERYNQAITMLEIQDYILPLGVDQWCIK